jgi:hypothetical protein
VQVRRGVFGSNQPASLDLVDGVLGLQSCRVSPVLS